MTASEHISLSATAIQFKDGANVYTNLAAGVLTLGYSAGGEYVLVDSTGIEIYGGAVKRFEVTSAGLAYLGDQSNEHIKLSSSGMQIYDGVTQLAAFGETVLVGKTGANQSNVYIASGALHIRNNVTDVITLAANGDVTITGKIIETGNIADNAVSVAETALTTAAIGISRVDYTIIQSVEITTTGAPVQIQYSFQIYGASGASAGTTKVFRGATELAAITSRATGAGVAFAATHSYILPDTPVAGTHTYYIKVTATNITYCINRSLLVTELKK